MLTSTLGLSILGCAALAALCWLLSVLTREYSWVDRIWSLAPPLYVGFFLARTGLGNTRLLVMTVLATLWGARLTFNFARKGGYAKGGEDYRWAVLRGRMSPALFQVFNLVFISGIQNAIIYGITLPAWYAGEFAVHPFGLLDLVAAALFAGALLGETVADEQQWRFHQHKRAALARGETVEPPFNTTGLFRYSRHPAFFFEQAQWWAFYLFSVAATGAWLNPTIVGCAVLTALFHGSTNFTEEITLSRYPSYAAYQRRTSRLLPMPPRGAQAAATEST